MSRVMPDTARQYAPFLLLLTLIVALMLSATPVRAAVDAFEFDTQEQQERFRHLSNEFRCPMCQNTNLTGSSGGVAEDLRREIHMMIMEGQTDEQITRFMLDRYGDFILYRPRLTAETILLWFGPLLFLLAGGWVVMGIIRRARPVERVAAELDTTEQERLRKLLEKVDEPR